jgi:Asp-tRNA(Asn)/Glu-tRNA(Gln) amidotransferase A subunit family amidase
MARSVDDVELALAALGIASPRDFFCLPGAYLVGGNRSTRLEGRRFAVWKKAGWGDATDRWTRDAVEVQAAKLSDLGAETVEIADIDADGEDYMAIHWHMLYIGAPDYFGLPADERGRIHPVIGAMYDALLTQSAIFAADMQRRVAVAAARIAAQLDGYDYVLSPAVPVRAFPAEMPCPDPRLGAMSHQAFACWFNQIGWPSATVPVLDTGDGGCPVSVQISGKRFDDAGVLDVARLLEARRGFDIRWPRQKGKNV